MTRSRALARALVEAAAAGAPLTLAETIRPPAPRSIVPVGAAGAPATLKAATVVTPLNRATPATLRAAVVVALSVKPASKIAAAAGLTVDVTFLTTGSKKMVG